MVVIRNSLVLNLASLVFSFPTPIILALLINEIKVFRIKKIFQTISYLPYFLSWVVLAAIFTELLSPQTGIVNYFLSLFGIEPVYFLASKGWFRPVVILTGIWQNVGWSSILYLASIASINPELYEAAEIDGATRFHRALHITLPSITPVVVFCLIMSMGSLLRTNFEQIFNLQNPSIMEVAEVIDTYVYHVGLVSANYGFSTAISLFMNLVGIAMLFIANNVIKKFSEYTLW
ncbi:MAG: sugar ABC transporter permease [Ruminiclostridium sp.]|nr:sugar ABC transporter permease [Ruminiclostridium sp.]